MRDSCAFLSLYCFNNHALGPLAAYSGNCIMPRCALAYWLARSRHQFLSQSDIVGRLDGASAITAVRQSTAFWNSSRVVRLLTFFGGGGGGGSKVTVPHARKRVTQRRLVVCAPPLICCVDTRTYIHTCVQGMHIARHGGSHLTSPF